MTAKAADTETEAPARQTVSAVMFSITGHDEIAINLVFKKELTDMRNPLRALAFVLFRRQGDKDGVAYRKALDLPLGDLDKMFEDEPTEEDEQGEG